jgi:hypothetical protein
MRGRRYTLEERPSRYEDEEGRNASGELRANATRGDSYPRPNRPSLSETVESYLEARTKAAGLSPAQRAALSAGGPPPLLSPQDAHQDFGTQVSKEFLHKFTGNNGSYI